MLTQLMQLQKFKFKFQLLFYLSIFIFLKKYLFILERGKGGRKRGRETSMCGCLQCTPYWGPDPQPRHVPWLGIQPATLWFAVQNSLYWATPARALSSSCIIHWKIKLPWWCLFYCFINIHFLFVYIKMLK